MALDSFACRGWGALAHLAHFPSCRSGQFRLPSRSTLAPALSSRSGQFRLPATGGGALARPSSGLHPGLRAESRVPRPDRAGLGPNARHTDHPEFVARLLTCRLRQRQARPRGPGAEELGQRYRSHRRLGVQRRCAPYETHASNSCEASAQREPDFPPSRARRQPVIGVANSCSINARREQRALRPGWRPEEGVGEHTLLRSPAGETVQSDSSQSQETRHRAQLGRRNCPERQLAIDGNASPRPSSGQTCAE